MPHIRPFAAPFLAAMACAAALSIFNARDLSAEQAAEPSASPAEVRSNNEAVKEMVAPDKLVEGSDGTKYPSTGPAKPVETWMSACPPHGAAPDGAKETTTAQATKDCRKPDDASAAKATQ